MVFLYQTNQHNSCITGIEQSSLFQNFCACILGVFTHVFESMKQHFSTPWTTGGPKWILLKVNNIFYTVEEHLQYIVPCRFADGRFYCFRDAKRRVRSKL